MAKLLTKYLSEGVFILLLSSCSNPEFQIETLNLEDLRGTWKLLKTESSNPELIDFGVLRSTASYMTFQDEHCVWYSSSCNEGPVKFVMQGNEILIEDQTCNRLKNRSGRYHLNKDTLIIVSYDRTEHLYVKADTVITFNCFNNRLVSDTISRNRYYETEIFSTEHLSIYGKWAGCNISGGLGGSSFDPEYDYLELSPSGIFAFIKNDSIISQGSIRIEMGPSLTNQTKDDSLLRFIPSIPINWQHPAGGLVDELKFFILEDCRLVIGDNGFDGFHYTFYRKPSISE